jgi:REP element-mobilizing transposase RayT
MSRPLRIEFAGALYHVMARGNAREAIFADDVDRAAFVDGIVRACERFDWVLWAYCLMDNHYHLLIETRRASLSRGMREINGIHTQRFNRRHQRVGHVLQGRYKAVLVDKDSYLLELSRYIVLNPVRARLCASAADWPWSSYRAVMGQDDPLPSLASDETLSLFGTQRAAARRAYARFVADGVGAFDPDAAISSQVFLGDEAFVARATKKAASPSREVPKKQRTWKSLSRYEREATTRNEAIRAAYASGAYTLSQIGQHFNLHYASVSRIARVGDV